MVWTHVHSMFSAKDALPHPVDIVARAEQLRLPALALTDHGNMGGIVPFYLACRKAGIEPLPGIEAYVAFERSREGKGRKRAETFHLTMLATNLHWLPQPGAPEQPGSPQLLLPAGHRPR